MKENEIYEDLLNSQRYKEMLDKTRKERMDRTASVLARQQVETNEELAKRKLDVEKRAKIDDFKIQCDEFALKKQTARLSNQLKLSLEKDAYVKSKGKIDMKNKLARSAPLLFCFSIVLTFISTIMSMSSVSHLHNPLDLVKIFGTKYYISAMLMATTQMITIILSALAYGLKTYYKRMNYVITIIRMLVLVVSICTNHQYLISIIPEYRQFSGYGIYLGWFFAGSADMLSLIVSSLATRLKHRLYDNDDATFEEETGYLEMIIYNLTFPLTTYIQNTYHRNKLKRLEQKKMFSGNPKIKLEEKPALVFDADANMSSDELEKYRNLILSCPAGQKVSKEMIKVNNKEWRKIRDYYVNEGLLICKNKSTYRSSANAA